MAAPLSDEFTQEFVQLTAQQQAEAIAHLEALRMETMRRQQEDPAYREERRKALLELAGSISAKDLELMEAAIEYGCERIGSS